MIWKVVYTRPRGSINTVQHSDTFDDTNATEKVTNDCKVARKVKVQMNFCKYADNGWLQVTLRLR